MKQRIALICALLIASLVACGHKGQSERGDTAGTPEVRAKAEAAAVDAAQGWLELVDSGDYGESWEEAAAFFRNAVGKERHVQSMEAARAPLGGLVSRNLTSKKYQTTLRGAPEGQYVVMEFRTSFSSKQQALETVTAMLDDDEWRVAGYYIK